MSRYVAKLIQQLKPNNLNYTKYKTRYNYFSEKYIIIPSAKALLFMGRNFIPLTIATTFFMCMLYNHKEEKVREKEMEELTERARLLGVQIDNGTQKWESRFKLEMARRVLTRMDLRMEDLQEYEVMKKSNERKKLGQLDSLEGSILGLPGLNNQKNHRACPKETVHERIGYNPAPRNPQ